jgi:predicted esterase
MRGSPTIHVSVHVRLNGARVPAWMDSEGHQERSIEPCVGLEESTSVVEALIEGEMARGIAPRRIVLGGFSQGGALGGHAALRLKGRLKLGGLACLSGYLPGLSRKAPPLVSWASSDPPPPLALCISLWLALSPAVRRCAAAAAAGKTRLPFRRTGFPGHTLMK